MLDKVRTVLAGADAVGGGRGVWGDGGGEGEAGGRQGHQITETGMGKTWVNAAQNKSGAPKDKRRNYPAHFPPRNESDGDTEALTGGGTLQTG